MHNPYRLIVFMWMIVMGNFNGVNVFAKILSLPDSLITDDYVYEYTFSEFDKAKSIMEELRVRKKLSDIRLDVVEGDLYFNTGRYYQALKFYRRVLESDSVCNNDVEYMEQVHRMISCYDCLHDEVKKAYYVRLLLKKAEECNNVEMKSVALFNMGKMIYYQEDKQRGYQMIKEAILLMKQADYEYKYDNLRYNYNTLLIMQQRDKHYEDALHTLNELEEVVAEATHKEPVIEGMEEKERKTMYAQQAVILSRLGRLREADEAYRLWTAIGDAYSKDDYLIIPYLMDRKLYDKVIEMYAPREAFLYAHKDTINYHMMTVKRSLGKAYKGKRDYKRATKYFEELAILTDSLKAREQQSSAIELATIYETHEREVELQEQIRQVKIRNLLLLSVGSALFFLSLLFLRSLQYTRTTRRKNVAMVKTIQELMVFKKELYEAKEKIRELSERAATDTSDFTVADIGYVRPIANSCENEENRLLFEEMDSIVMHEKLFLKNDLSRDDLMKLIHVNKNRFGKILQQNNMNAASYINGKRLEYAAKLLEEAPNFTITAIAELSGIPNVPTFNRLFRSKFEMTPSEYRNSLKTADYKAKVNDDGQSGIYL